MKTAKAVKTEELNVPAFKPVGVDPEKAVTSKDFAATYNPKLEEMVVRRLKPDTVVTVADIGKVVEPQGGE